MLPNKGLVDALYERMFGDHHQSGSEDSKYSSSKDISGESIQQNSWAQNEIRQRIIDAPNNKHAQRKHDLLDERTAGFKNLDEGDFGNEQQSQDWSGAQQQSQQQWSGSSQPQSWSNVPQSQNWSGIGQDISSQGLSGQSFGGYGQGAGASQQNWQGSGVPSQQSASQHGTSYSIPISQGQQFSGQQQFSEQGGVPSYEEQRAWAPPLPQRQI